MNSFKERLDSFWNDQEVKFNWKADIKGTRYHSDETNDCSLMLQWSREWQMLFSVSKYKVMHAGRNDALQEYEMEGQTLEAVQKERDLGVIITKDMKAPQQCRQAYSKANKMLGNL